MAQKKRGLGKGLGDLGLTELLSDFNQPASTQITETSTESSAQNTSKKEDGIKYLPIEFIKPGKFQPRRNFDATTLSELADSIRAQGIIQPLVLRPVAKDRYEIIAGERRWRAAQQAGLDKVPVIIREINDEAAIAIALIENIQRQDLNAIEEATALQRLIDECGLTHEAVATAIGKSRTTVTNLLRLLNLNPKVKSMLEQGLIEMGLARALLPLDFKQQNDIANVVVARALSVRETEQYIRQLQNLKANAGVSKRKDPNIVAFEKQLADKFGLKVKVHHQSSGKGKLVLYYNSVDELQGVLDEV